MVRNTHKKIHESKMHCLPVLEDSVKLQGSNVEKNEAMLFLTRKLPNTMRKHLCRKWVQNKTNRPLNAFFPPKLANILLKTLQNKFFGFFSFYIYLQIRVSLHSSSVVYLDLHSM